MASLGTNCIHAMVSNCVHCPRLQDRHETECVARPQTSVEPIFHTTSQNAPRRQSRHTCTSCSARLTTGNNAAAASPRACDSVSSALAIARTPICSSMISRPRMCANEHSASRSLATKQRVVITQSTIVASRTVLQSHVVSMRQQTVMPNHQSLRPTSLKTCTLNARNAHDLQPNARDVRLKKCRCNRHSSAVTRNCHISRQRVCACKHVTRAPSVRTLRA
jgi:hypothetical protein